MTKQKVLQLIDGLNVGGAEALLVDLTRGLARAGYEVIVGYSSPGPLEEQLREQNIPLVHLPRLSRVDPILLFRICLLILREKPDIVHTHLFKSDLHGRTAARLCGVPVVVSTIHNNDAWASKFPLGSIYGWTASLASRIIAVSDEVRAYHIEHTYAEPGKMTVISNGVDLKRFTAPSIDPRAVRAEFQAGPSTKMVGIIGRLQPQKDHKTFLLAARKIADEIKDVRFLIVGDGPLRQSLMSQSDALGLFRHVIFTGIREDIPAILSALDLLVVSSQWEGLPVTLLEGMAARCPIVATRVGGIPDVVRSEESALLVPPQDPDELAGACLRVLKDSQLARRLRDAAYERVRLRFSMDAMINKTVEVYQSLWEETNGRHPAARNR